VELAIRAARSGSGREPLTCAGLRRLDGRPVRAPRLRVLQQDGYFPDGRLGRLEPGTFMRWLGAGNPDVAVLPRMRTVTGEQLLTSCVLLLFGSSRRFPDSDSGAVALDPYEAPGELARARAGDVLGYPLQLAWRKLPREAPSRAPGPSSQ
jgi:hypothetical protein